MTRLLLLASLAAVAGTVTACSLPKKYECTIRDTRTGEVLEKTKVNSRAECDALALKYRF